MIHDGGADRESRHETDHCPWIKVSDNTIVLNAKVTLRLLFLTTALMLVMQWRAHSVASAGIHDNDARIAAAAQQPISREPKRKAEVEGRAARISAAAQQPISRKPKRKTPSQGKSQLMQSEVSCGGHFAPTCAACPQGHGAEWCNGQCWFTDGQCVERPSFVHPDYHVLLKEAPFQPVSTEDGTYVNIILVKTPFSSQRHEQLFQQYKDDILFLGISSFESFPLSSPNPFSANFSNSLYQSKFPGWLTMMRHPENYFNVTKYILLSQSDFNLDPPLDYGRKNEHLPKKYDFTYSGTDQDVANGCVGWSCFAKNWTFALQALEIMCSDEFNLTGVLVATKDKHGKKACAIPPACHGKMQQTTYLANQNDFYHYVVQSKFLFVPQVYDASPRVTTQALSINVPLLMNDNIVGGWKYLNPQTGEFFHDLSNFKTALTRIIERTKVVDEAATASYQPRTYVTKHYGNALEGVKFKNFVLEHWSDRVSLPDGTKWLFPA